MRLSQREFLAMNNPLRRFLQRHVEYRFMRSLGLDASGRDVLEIGCGSGYGAELLFADEPCSYAGIDVMEEQIELARARGLPGAEFSVGDAADLAAFADDSRDLIVIFGILHHIPAWRRVLDECHRVLRVGGELFLEEPDRFTIQRWDRLFKFGHQREDQLTLDGLESKLETIGFLIVRQWRRAGLGVYRARKVRGLR